jgi:organic radical activating enzyme
MLAGQPENWADIIHVMPGLFCNFSCAHCAPSSGPRAKYRLTPEELSRIHLEVSTRKPRALLFTGGEPTFHVDEINQVIAAHPDINNCLVEITTNGWFAKSIDQIDETFSRFKKISHIQLSYDSYHKERPSIEEAKLLKRACEMRGITFSISIAISEPSDLIFVESVRQQTGANVTNSRVEAAGRAKRTKTAFKHFDFNPSVLEKMCPNLGTMNFICGKGFSVCCTNLVFNAQKQNYFHDSIDEHLNSQFFKLVSTHTFGQIAEKLNLKLDSFQPEHSNVCGMCEHLHCQMAERSIGKN